jgi:NADH-quinone oxidoreductase subunit C
MSIEEIKERIEAEFPGAVEELRTSSTPACLQIKRGVLPAVCQWLHSDPVFYMDSLSCLTALDNGPEAGSLEVIYTLYSIPHGHSFQLACLLDRSQPEIQSVSTIWRTADWHEREAYDFYGIHFQGHPDLRRILLPADWEGHPLKKDYEHQEKYHGITVKY